MPPATPASISLPDRYRVVRHLANGGMASVWEAHDELLDRDVAVKLLASHLGEDERARRRFQREARAAAGLSSHPHVVTIYDVGEWRGRVFMVMEIMRGGTIGDRLRSGRAVGQREVLRWLREAAGALDTAHAAGVVHRDIKPGNLLLDAHDRLGVADFGIARLAWEDQLTATGQVLGTAAYLSPEQAMGEPASAASDRYALAVVAYEMLTGSRPFEAEHFAAQARAHVEDPVPPASSRANGLSKAVDAVLERGLAKDPAERWGTATEFVDALERTLNAPSEVATKPTRRLFGRRAAAAAAGARAGDTAEHDVLAAGAAAGQATNGRASAGGRDGLADAAAGQRGDGRADAAAGAADGRDDGWADGGAADRRGAAAAAGRGSDGRAGRDDDGWADDAVASGGRGRSGNGRYPSAAPEASRRRSGPPLLVGLGALALLAVIAAIALASRGADDDNQRAQQTPTATKTATRTATASPTATATAEKTDTPTPDPTDTPTAEPTDTPTSAPTDTATAEPKKTPKPRRTTTTNGTSDLRAASAAQVAGYNARRAGDYNTALAKAQQATQLCAGAHELNPCGYALFEQGVALTALGQPDAAIPILQQRLDQYGDNESGEVRKALKDAQKAARKD